MYNKVGVLAIIVILSLILITGCGADITTKEVSVTLERLTNEFYQRENIKFQMKTVIHRDEQMATVDLTGVEFIETNQAYYLGTANELRLEIYKTDKITYLKSQTNTWVSVEEGGASELKTFISLPSRLLDFAKFADLAIIDDSLRLNRRRHIVFSGELNEDGVKNYISSHVPELVDIIDEVFVELSIYIDYGTEKISKIDIFINELSGNFSLVSEITLVEFDIDTQIVAPK
ncbi:hypothetical protein HYG86_02195 [Alkalicella caledoniensis]|uniref:LppX_LprAFG lipoprotein n=1 Tax=Alkalicella caledoniensis TaxID=2731377 RepID=A0A7G9W4P9_ALKCA|nr:hypothetical protein [Alkalicella caledoniensis]QNO13661.1 hypothetical protein HYG86_02195 [Alkalicella caledoniensis]